MPFDLPLCSQYLLLRTSPPADELTLRQTLQENLGQAFGTTAAGTHVDVLWVGNDGRALVRVGHRADATRVLASIVTTSSSPRLVLIKTSVFLPSLLVDDDQVL
ncbi:hypothetical protein K438DRAFT_1562465 [Mycena galopus ATCC 62051]|nr:hypothetical protein K438DRAFT_1562465 [Mycena galopus ATCC 62051]